METVEGAVSVFLCIVTCFFVRNCLLLVYALRILGEKMDKSERIIKIRESTGMSRSKFCEYFGIPYRTLQDWELGNREMPDYLLRLIAYKVKMEKLDRKENTVMHENC